MRSALPLGASNDMNSLHILVVEDEPILRNDIATYLRDCGCAIYEAATAEEAILMCSTVSFRLHVLFTDIHLNGAAVGLEVADVFRAARPAIGVLYTSGNPLNRARCLPGSRFLPKPYNKGEVLKACRDMHRGRISSESRMLGPIGFRSLGV
jgi:CheY-like chemotaxis protein